MSQSRYIPNWPFPDYAYIPGVNEHPHLEDPKATRVELGRELENDFFKFALDLFNHGYFWESHVYFEALWNAHEREGSIADFCKMMIQLCAAGIKLNQSNVMQALHQFNKALGLLDSLEKKQGNTFLGFNLKQIEKDIHESLQKRQSVRFFERIAFISLKKFFADLQYRAFSFPSLLP